MNNSVLCATLREKKDKKDYYFCVIFSNKLREIVGRRSEANKAGAKLVSDYDLIAATHQEKLEAFEFASIQKPTK